MYVTATRHSSFSSAAGGNNILVYGSMHQFFISRSLLKPQRCQLQMLLITITLHLSLQTLVQMMKTKEMQETHLLVRR
ncbi:hypothetical protein HanHA300_Chr06g0220291 [Helianthus annuus]|nr:hypothetical protein HanHA300_Chr06g0220291 [Helianthus annuus]